MYFHFFPPHPNITHGIIIVINILRIRSVLNKKNRSVRV